MSRINLLEKQVYQLIAAGEVVERPASVVKELIENSIDAGSTHVTVEIKGGGIGYIRITDNGSGIDKEDIPKAFMRHATSKINKEEDLEAIFTLGFRGEALSSISAVSKIELTTKTTESDMAYVYSIIDQDNPDLLPAGAPDGTTIIIRDLFYNTPARMKFLRSDTAEGNAVAQVVEKAALSHPEVAFNFIRDTATKLQTSGNNDLLAVIAKIYDAETANNMLKVDYDFEGAVKVYGYVGNPSVAKPNRRYQTFFVNNRYVRTATASTALGEAFKGKIMTGKFPFGVLFIDIDPSKTDINVHPAKIEVRFDNDKIIYNAVYFGVKTALTRSGQVFGGAEESATVVEVDSAQAQEKPVEDKSLEQTLTQMFTTKPQQKPRNYSLDIEVDEPIVQQSFKFVEPEVSPSEPLDFNSTTSTHSIKSMPVTYNFHEETPGIEETEEAVVPTANIGYKVVGQLLNTYILLESSSESLLLVDKHAAHEQIIYKKITQESGEGMRQVLLSSQTVALGKDEHAALLENEDALLELGFLIEDFGTGTIIVRETPTNLASKDTAYILTEIAGKLLENRLDITPESLNQLHYSIACKAAVRGGDRNSDAELEQIIRLLEDNPEITHCPHGRPIFVEVSKKDIEKMFGRLG